MSAAAEATRTPAELLFENNLLLVEYVIGRTALPRWADGEDLRQVGRLALWKSANAYDPARGFKFSTYAFKAILRVLGDYVDRQRRHHRGRVGGFLAEGVAGRAEGPKDHSVAVGEAVTRLPERLAFVVSGRLAGRSLGDIGRELGVSPEWVRQLEARARGLLAEDELLRRAVEG